jgi:hypothetical protein
MPSAGKKEERADKKALREQERKATMAMLEQIPQHNAVTVTVDGNEITLKIDVNFKKSSNICLVIKEGPRKDQSK